MLVNSFPQFIVERELNPQTGNSHPQPVDKATDKTHIFIYPQADLWMDVLDMIRFSLGFPQKIRPVDNSYPALFKSSSFAQMAVHNSKVSQVVHSVVHSHLFIMPSEIRRLGQGVIFYRKKCPSAVSF